MADTLKGSPKAPEQTKEELLTIYVADEILVRARNMARSFSFLMDEPDFVEAMDGFNSSYKKPSQNIEELRGYHSKLVQTLKAKEGGNGVASISAIRPSGSRSVAESFEIPEEIVDFDEIVQRVTEDVEDENLHNSLESAADSVVLGEVKLADIMTRHLFQVKRRALEAICGSESDNSSKGKPLSAELGMDTKIDDLEEEMSESDLVNRIGEKRVMQLLELSDKEVKGSIQALTEEADKEVGDKIIKLIIEVRKMIREDEDVDEETRKKETSRIKYDEPKDDILDVFPGHSLEDIEGRLGDLTKIEEAALRMAHSISTEDRLLEFFDEVPGGGLTEYIDRVEHIERKTLKHLHDLGELELPKDGLVKDGAESVEPDDGNVVEIFGRKKK